MIPIQFYMYYILPILHIWLNAQTLFISHKIFLFLFRRGIVPFKFYTKNMSIILKNSIYANAFVLQNCDGVYNNIF